MLELQNVKFDVPDADAGGENPPRKTIVNDVSFTFKTGGFYAITGPNGSGKTSLAKLIMASTRLHPGK